ncbi:MAG: S8 family serine peptidase [Planctomycetes bacterium]|nr:S8 family serine peptidase [Planctomycetota bacterium]
MAPCRFVTFVILALAGILAAESSAQWRLVGPGQVRVLEAEADRLVLRLEASRIDAVAARLGLDASAFEAHALPGYWLVRTTDPGALRARALELSEVGFASPLFRDDCGGPAFPVRSIIVLLDRAEAEEAVLAALTERGGGRVLERDWQGLAGALLIEPASRDGGLILDLAAAMSTLPGVRFAEPDLCFTGRSAHLPNDPRFIEMWGFNLGLQLGLAVTDCDVDAPEAWDLSQGDAAIKIAVLDDGVQRDHPDMPQDLPGTDTTGLGLGDGSPSTAFDNHGSSVAGLIVGRPDNGYGIAGLAPEVQLHRVRCYDSTGPGVFTTMSSWTVAALSYCETEGIRITNNSVVLGLQPMATTTKYDTTAANGMIHYAAAGNDPQLGTRYPANLASVRGLIGLGYNGQIASFSASGPDMDYTGPAEQLITCDRSGSDGYNADDFVYQQGTSFATATATAIGALVLSINPLLTDVDVHEIMAAGAMDLGAPGFDATYGHGLINAFHAAWRAAMTRSDPEAVIWMQTSVQLDSRQGAAVVLVGDVDGDGRPEFAIGAPEHDGVAGVDCGRVELRSGRSGAILWAIEGTEAGERFGAALAAPGDLDGDGLPDLAIGAPAATVMGMVDAGRVVIHSGGDGSFIRDLPGGAAAEAFGAALAAMGDLNGNGFGDLAIGAPGAIVGMTAAVGRVAILDGQNGATIGAASGNETAGEREFGFALARTADHDNDGLADLLVGAPGSLYGGSDSGALVVFGSISGNRITTIAGTTAQDRLGQAVATWGDQTGDGVEDYVAGVPGFSLAVGPDGGAAVVFSSASSLPVLAYFGHNPGDRQGEALCASIDVDGDTVPDLAIGAPGYDGATMADIGRVEVWSTASTRPRFELVGGRTGQRFGAALAALGDIDGDGLGEFIVGAPGDGAMLAGYGAIFPAANPARLGPLPAAIAAGQLGGGGSGPYDTFYVNESAGGLDRTVHAAIGQDLDYSMLQPFANPNPANFALFAYLGVPPSYLELTLPFGIGPVLWLPCTASPANPIGFLVTNSTGLDPCPQLVSSTPTPWRFTHVGGLPFPLTVTFYGIVEETPATLSVTNAVVLVIG